MSAINLDFPPSQSWLLPQHPKDLQTVTAQHGYSTHPRHFLHGSTLQNLLVNMPFPDKDDNTAAYPTYLPVLELVAWNISTSTSSVNDEQKPQTVGYAFLAPRRKTTTGDASTMERFLYPDYSDMHVGSSLFTMLLMLVQSECGIGVFGWVVTEESGYVQYLRHANRVRRVVAAVSIDTDASEGGEWLPRWLESKGFWEARRVRNLAVEMVRVKGVRWVVLKVRGVQ